MERFLNRRRELDVLGLGLPGMTGRPAEDPRGTDAGEEEPLERLISFDEGPVHLGGSWQQHHVDENTSRGLSSATEKWTGNFSRGATVPRASRGPETSRPQPRADIDGYLAGLPADKRAALQKLRKDIKAAAPRAEEGLSYGLPGFRLDGRPLACFAAAANHCSLHPMSAAVIRAHAADLAGYETSKGTIRFPAGKPLPSTLVRKIVKTRMAELQARK
jgi:uncharacterized protein YdhG (YjbR/CyaY superfamily)